MKGNEPCPERTLGLYQLSGGGPEELYLRRSLPLPGGPEALLSLPKGHDAFTRLLRRQPPDTEALWRETQGLVQLEGGVLVLDDTTLDKPYARRMELLTRHWSGKHRRVVQGINLLIIPNIEPLR